MKNIAAIRLMDSKRCFLIGDPTGTVICQDGSAFFEIQFSEKTLHDEIILMGVNFQIVTL